MKLSTSFGVFVLAMVISTAAFGQDDATVAEAKAAYGMALRDFNSGQYEAYLGVFATDVEAYTGVYTPLRFEGKEAWQQFILGLKAFEAVSYEQRGLSFRSFNEDAVLVNAYFIFTTVAKDGVVEVQSGRESTTLIKVDGKWLIANMHFSPLF